MMEESVHPASFRDPSGFLFVSGDQVYRQVNESYQANYDALMQSGLYQSLIDKGWLLAHEEVAHPDANSSSKDESPEPAQVPDQEQTYYKILLPEQIPYISYPYEWCFGQLKDAALLTLNVQMEALKHNMILKDATAYNVQFHKSRPVFIDTLSFEVYEEGVPWIAYRQFCQHFLAPLAMAAILDIRTLQLLRAYIDGIPLDLASRLLPRRSWLRYSLLAHIHLHARSQKRFEDTGRTAGAIKRGANAEGAASTQVSVSRPRMEGLIASLHSAVEGLQWKQSATEWGDYYADTNYIDTSMLHKEALVHEMLLASEKGEPAIAADFGANTGKFSRLAINTGYYVISHDIDVVAVEKNYQTMKATQQMAILPLILDITNPSPGLGWASIERDSFVDRQKADVGLALALVHHIAISNNVPLPSIARLFSKMCRNLIIEFVPKSDSQVRRLLATREDIFPDYTEEGFDAAFDRYFVIEQKTAIQESERIMYLMFSREHEYI